MAKATRRPATRSKPADPTPHEIVLRVLAGPQRSISLIILNLLIIHVSVHPPFSRVSWFLRPLPLSLF